MSFFVSREEVPISLDDESVPFEERNTIFIKPKMDYGTQQKVTDALAHITASQDGKGQGRLNMGAYNCALLHHNIIRWQGPGFQAMPCTPENIDRLDPDLPLLDRVLEEINKRNTKQNTEVEGDDEGKSPNSPTSATSGRSKGSK